MATNPMKMQGCKSRVNKMNAPDGVISAAFAHCRLTKKGKILVIVLSGKTQILILAAVKIKCVVYSGIAFNGNLIFYGSRQEAQFPFSGFLFVDNRSAHHIFLVGLLIGQF